MSSQGILCGLAATFLLIAGLIFAQPANARESVIGEIAAAWNTRTHIAPPASIEVGFSPNGGAQELILKAIATAKSSIHVLAYSFTSKPVASALLVAHKRGVKIYVVVDKSQRTEKYTSATFLANQGIPVRIDAKHSIQHNKVLIIDQQHIQTGSYNYSSAADRSNAENAIVIWANPQLAQLYLVDWMKHWEHAEAYPVKY